MVINLSPLIDLRKFKISKGLESPSVVLGYLNLLGWVVLKSDMSLNDELSEHLAKLCVITQNDYWERLVQTDGLRRCVYPSGYNDDSLKN